MNNQQPIQYQQIPIQQQQQPQQPQQQNAQQQQQQRPTTTNIVSPIQIQPQPQQQQQQPQQQNPSLISPRNNTKNTTISSNASPINPITSPLPTTTMLTQNLLSIENKATQLQQINKEIFRLLKITTPTTSTPSSSSSSLIQDNNNNNDNNNNSSSNDINSLEYFKNVHLLNQYKTKVFELIKELQNDLVNQNPNTYFLTPVLNDQQDTLFYEPPLPITNNNNNNNNNNTAESLNPEGNTEINNSEKMIETSPILPFTAEQHNTKLFIEKFQQHLTVETVQKQLQEWDSVSKDRDKLNKNADRVKQTLFNDKNR
ncbi:hypothetical protein ACTFIW_002443 [Dictyostelium discoideum]